MCRRPSRLQARPKARGSVARAVVGHHALDADAELGIVGDRGLEEGDGALLALIRHDLDEGDARGIVDADMDVLPTDAAAVALSPAIAGDAVADAVDPSELFDVDMDQFAGMFALVAADWFGRLQGCSLLSPRRRSTRLTVAGEMRTRQRSACRSSVGGAALDLVDHRLGRRLTQPMRPGAAILQSGQAFAAISVNPFANGPRADACGFADGLRRLPALNLPDNPLSTTRRQPGILVHVHPVLPWNLKSRNLSFLGQNRMDNLLKAHI